MLTMHDSFTTCNLCDGSFTHDSQESLHPDIHTLYNPVSWVWAGQGDVTPVVENTQKWCGVPLKLGYKHLSCWHSFFPCPLTWSLWWTRLACCELLTQRFMWQGTEGSPWPTALRPVTQIQQLQGIKSWQYPLEWVWKLTTSSLKITGAPTHTLMTTLRMAQKQDTQEYHA